MEKFDSLRSSIDSLFQEAMEIKAKKENDRDLPLFMRISLDVPPDQQLETIDIKLEELKALCEAYQKQIRKAIDP